MYNRLFVRTTLALLLLLGAVLFFDYVSFPLDELPAPHHATLRTHVSGSEWEAGELYARRVTGGYAVTLTHRYRDGRVISHRYEVSDTLVVTELGVSITYPLGNTLNILLALTLGVLLSGYAASTWLRRRRRF